MKTEIFNRILCLVAEKTGVNEERLISLERTEEVIDARAMAVYLCRKYGLSNQDIRVLFGRSGHHFTQHMYDLCVAKKPLIIVNNYRPLPRFRSGCKYC